MMSSQWRNMGRDRMLTTGAWCVPIFCAAICSGQPALLPNGSPLITWQGLTPPLASSLQAMGARLQTPDKAQVTLVGTVTDSGGSRNAQITVQAPGYWAYREGSSRAVTFDGTSFSTKSGSLTADDEAVGESLLAHLPDSIFLQVAYGGSLRRIGSHFRTDDGKSKAYTGPYWTVFAFAPRSRQGLTEGKALQQPIFIAIDEGTGLLSDVRVAIRASQTAINVVQTQFSNWIQQGGQWFPGEIVRLENGRQTLSFQTQQAGTGPALAVAAFRP
jgi:hypothetical protein